MRNFLEELGWDFDTPPSALDSVRPDTETVTSLVDGGEVESSEIPALATAVNQAISSILNLNDAPGVSDEFKANFPRELVDYLIVEQLLNQQPRWGNLLLLLGLVRLEVVDETTTRPAHVRRVLAIEDVDDFIANPIEYLRLSYRWGQSAFDGERLFNGLHDFLDAWGVNVREGALDAPTLATIAAGALAPDAVDESTLQLIFFESDDDPVNFGAGIELCLLPETAAKKPGFALLPYTNVEFEEAAEIAENLTLAFKASFDLTGGCGILVRPNENVEVASALSSGVPAAVSTELRVILKLAQPDAPILILGDTEGSRLECGGISAEGGTRSLGAGAFEVFSEFAVEGGKVVIKPKPTEKDGFLAELLPDDGISIDFDLGIGFSTERGVYFVGSAGFEIPLASHLQLGPIEIVKATLGVHFRDAALPVDLAASVRGDFSILKATVENVGLTANFTFPDDRKGNLGPVDLELSFKPPTGIGVVIDASSVSGGGYLAIDRENGRYAGAIELKVFSIAVKAFGLIDTRFPDGGSGYSFVIVIVAEFTPIQLGFGFTLLGVGGLLGLHRSVDNEALSAAVRSGSLEHVLFPHDPVGDAPAIVNDLAAIFPPARSHFIIGPMGKLGWGTPTLITASVGILLEFPGPRLGLIGVVSMELPSAEAALLRLHMAIAGLLDFPAKFISVDASLYDSNVVGMPIAGDMAFRMRYGSKPSFLVSVGGFNPGFVPPPPFPTLRRCSVDLGVNGNPSLVASGYFAVTSNSAQVGASLDLNASGAGIRLHGWLGFDALFVFSPFSFKASISAGVRVSFHGVGLGVNLGGTISGPSPWRFSGKVCVSVLFWDACLPVNIKFGHEDPASLQEVDPWFGTPAGTDARVQATGLESAVGDIRNWSGSAPPAGISVVTLAQSASEQQPIDPMGPASLRQKVVPLDVKLQKFGEYRPKEHDQFRFSSAKLNDEPEAGPDQVTFTTEQFVPGHFLDLKDDKKLSRDSYEEMKGGFTIAPNNVKIGSEGHQTLAFETALINDAGERSVDPTPFGLTAEQLRAMLGRSASALNGIRRAGSNKYMLDGRPKRVSLSSPKYFVADACTGVANTAVTPTPVSRIDAEQALDDYLLTHPEATGQLEVLLAA
jgi:hypothetical protein